MRANHRACSLLCAAAMLIGVAHPGRTLAGDTAEILESQRSQTADPGSIQLPSDSQGPPYRLEQEAAAPEPQGLKGYLDANEQISVFGIDLRVETRTAERKSRDCWSLILSQGAPEPRRDCIHTVSLSVTY